MPFFPGSQAVADAAVALRDGRAHLEDPALALDSRAGVLGPGERPLLPRDPGFRGGADEEKLLTRSRFEAVGAERAHRHLQVHELTSRRFQPELIGVL